MRNDRLFAYIEREEGRSTRAYFCPSGDLTIGVGHNITKNGLPSATQKMLEKYGKIDSVAIDNLLIEDIKIAKKGCWEIYGRDFFDSLSDVRQAVLISMCFQIGQTGLSKFIETNRLIKARSFEDASVQMLKSKWARQTKNRAKRASDMMRDDKWEDWIETKFKG